MRKIKVKTISRIETGALQINDDWTGLFIRGDSCIELREVLGKVLRHERLNWFEERVLEVYFLEIDRRVLIK